MQHNVQPLAYTDDERVRRSVDGQFPAVGAFLASADARRDADLMRVDAPQVTAPRVHTIRLLDVPGATLTVTCPDWCVSEHQEETARGTLAADFTHYGAELALPTGADRDGSPLTAQLVQAPFSADLRAPVVSAWRGEVDMTPQEVRALAGSLRAFADDLDELSVDLDDARHGDQDEGR